VRREIMADDKIAPADKDEVEDIEVLDQADGTALPEVGASSGNTFCCSSSSSTCSLEE
jgi:thiazolylpeptide-type bacteriocin precursor